MNKFEQVFSDDYQMSLAGAGPGGPMTHVLGGGVGSGEARIVRSNASWVMVTWGPPSPLWTDRHTLLKTLPSRYFVGRL